MSHPPVPDPAADHKLERCREVIRELRRDPRANIWRAVGRLEAILDMLDDEEKSR